MFEAERLQVKSQVMILNLPLLRKMEEFPFTAALFTAVIVSVFVLPSRILAGSVPDDLWVRADKKIVPPAL